MNEVFYASNEGLYYILSLLGIFILNRVLKLLLRKPKTAEQNSDNFDNLKENDQNDSEMFSLNEDIISSQRQDNTPQNKSESPFDFIDDIKNINSNPLEKTANTGRFTEVKGRGALHREDYSDFIDFENSPDLAYDSKSYEDMSSNSEKNILKTNSAQNIAHNDSTMDIHSDMDISLVDMEDFDDNTDSTSSIFSNAIGEELDQDDEYLWDDFDARKAIISSEIIAKKY